MIAITSLVKHDGGIDTDRGPLRISGGTLFTCGRPQRGITSTPNEKTAIQPTAMLEGVDLTEGDDVVVYDESSKVIFSYRMPFAFPASNSLITCPQFEKGKTYSVQSRSFSKTLTFDKNFIKPWLHSDIWH